MADRIKFPIEIKKEKKELKTCTRCLYDETIPGITFDEKGVCNSCKLHDEMEKEYPTGKEGKKYLDAMVSEIKKAGKGNKYDCIIGVSGGCDSSYLLWYAKEQLGLRPLAVHFDNTWNTKIAVENIHTVLEKLNIDLFTYVMDNDEFNDLARSMLEASVPEADALTDIGLASTLYIAAEKFKIKHVLIGHAFRTEGMMPAGWFYFDGKYVADIHKRFGKMPMKRYPNLWFWKFIRWTMMGLKRYRPIYYLDYVKPEVMKFLEKEFGWQWYGGHHLENRYTFFHHYYNYKKFGIDGRMVELSAMIRSGTITRQEGVKTLSEPFEPPKDVIEEIKKRLNLSDQDYEEIMNAPLKSAKDYKTYNKLFKLLRPYFWLLYKMNLVPKNFYVKYCK